MSGDLVTKAEAARVAKEAAEKQIAELHAAMIDEMAESMTHGWTTKKYALDLLRASFGQMNTPVTMAELVIESMCFYGRVCAILSPEQGESVQQHARRINAWISDKWRKENVR